MKLKKEHDAQVVPAMSTVLSLMCWSILAIAAVLTRLLTFSSAKRPVTGFTIREVSHPKVPAR